MQGDKRTVFVVNRQGENWRAEAGPESSSPKPCRLCSTREGKPE